MNLLFIGLFNRFKQGIDDFKDEFYLSRNEKLMKSLEIAENDITNGRATECRSKKDMHNFLDSLKE